MAAATTMNELLTLAVQRGASDLHLAVGLPPALRVDGQLQAIEQFGVLSAAAVEGLVYPMISQEQRARFVAERDLDLAYEVAGVGRFRVNLHWERDVVGLVARVIPGTIPTMKEIEMPEIVYKLARLDQGLIIVTGPTGHGKSTSLAAMINLINEERSAHIVTLEDPIEFLFEPKKSIVKQRQLGTDMRSFAEGLKHVLRQDPNVIMVGEMRDLETIGAAITIAETGHLVLATLHTYSAAQTIDRIIDIFPPYQQPQVRMQVSITLKGIISQRLLPRKDHGRVAVREILINTPAVATLIRDNKIAQIKTAIQTGAAEGMRPMDQELIDLYRQGVIEKRVAVAYMLNPERLDSEARSA
jgi:twitching motility protein PilT